MATSVGDAFVDIRPNLATFNSEMSAAFGSSAFASKFSKYGKVAGVALVGGIAAAGVGKALFDIGKEFDDAFDTIQTKTGQTGKSLDRLKGDFKNVVGSVPVDFKDAADALGGLQQRMDLTHPQLRALTKQILALSKVTGTDVQENVSSITRLFGDWSVKTKDQADTLNELFRLTQVTGIQFSDLSQLMVQFGSPLRELGFRFDEAAAMFARFEREGVNMSTLLPGLRMALKNISVPTDDLAGLFDKLGIATKDPHEALMEIFKTISSSKVKEADKTLLASSVFGGRAWADMKAAIEEGRFSFSELIDTMKNGKGTIRGTEKSTRDFSEEWQLFVNRLKVAIEPAATAFFHAIGDGMKQISDIIGNRKLGWDQKLSALLKLFTGWLSDLVSAAVHAAPTIASALVKGFLNAPAWAKLAIGGFLIAKMGGWAAIKALGGRLGTTLFGGLASKIPGTSGGTIGKVLSERGSTFANPIFVEVVNQIPGGGPGGVPVPAGKKPPIPGNEIPGWTGWGTTLGLLGVDIGTVGLAQYLSGGAALRSLSPSNLFGKNRIDPARANAQLGPRSAQTDASKPLGNITDPDSAIRNNSKLSRSNDELAKSFAPVARGAKASSRVVLDEISGLRDKYGSLANAADDMSKRQRQSWIDSARQAFKDGAITRDQLKKIVSAFQETRDKSSKAADDQKQKVSTSFAKQVQNVLDSYRSLGKGVGVGLGNIRDDTNAALKALGLRNSVSFRTKGNVIPGQHVNTARKGAHVANVPGPDTGDTHSLVLDGEPIAAVSGSEGVFVGNSRMMGALAMVNRMIPRLRRGGKARGAGASSETIAKPVELLWHVAGHFDHLHAGFSDTPTTIAAGKAMAGMGYTVGEGPGPFGPITPGVHVVGSLHYQNRAVDVNDDDGSVFGGTEDASLSHLFGILSGGKLTGGVSAVWKNIARQILIGPAGPTLGVGQGHLDKAWKAANAYGKKQAGKVTATGGGNFPVGAGTLSKDEIRGLLKAHGMPDIMGFVSYAESGWDPNTGNGSYEGLWAEGSPFWSQFGGNKFGPWIPTVHDPNAAAAVASAGYKSLGLSPWEASRNAGAGGGWGQHLGETFRRGGRVAIPWFGGGGDFIARSPQLIGVGDRPERVQIDPVGGGSSRRYRMKITNWREGWAEMEELAAGAVARNAHDQSRHDRMSRR